MFTALDRCLMGKLCVYSFGKWTAEMYTKKKDKKNNSEHRDAFSVMKGARLLRVRE